MKTYGHYVKILPKEKRERLMGSNLSIERLGGAGDRCE
jgi:hypothetical protein